MKEKNLTCYQVFDQLRFPLIILVIYIHSNIHPVNYGEIDIHALTSNHFFDLCRLAIGTVFSQIAVPVYSFISGFLFFLSKKSYAEKQQKKRKQSLTVSFRT